MAWANKGVKFYGAQRTGMRCYGALRSPACATIPSAKFTYDNGEEVYHNKQQSVFKERGFNELFEFMYRSGA